MNYCGKIIEFGSTDQVAVKAIKVRLNALLGSKLDVNNGNFGEATKLVVQQFQRKNQLLSDGRVGELTWERLFTEIQPLAIQSTVLRLRAMEIMDTQLFVRELTGKNDGVEVEKYLKAVGLGKGYAWCMAYFFWAFQQSADELGLTNLVPKTAGVLDCYAKAKKLYLVSGDPEPGDQFIMDFGAGKGHTGMVTEFKKESKSVYTNEGNTSADPSYAGEDREGNGVFERSRKISTIKAFLRYK